MLRPTLISVTLYLLQTTTNGGYMTRRHQTAALITSIILASLGCMIAPKDAGYGAECEEDDDCGSDVFRDCRGGYCGGLGCKNRDCPEGFVCSEPATLLGYNISTPTCEKVCQDDNDCAATWQCQEERCAFLSKSKGALSVEVADIPRNGSITATLELIDVAGTASQVTWYIEPYDPSFSADNPKTQVAKTGTTLSHTYTFEEAGSFTLSASFEDYNGVTETTQNATVRVCLLEGDTCGGQQRASCCNGSCLIEDDQNEGICPP